MFVNQTKLNCPICKDPILTDASVVEFEHSPGIFLHSICVKVIGFEMASDIAHDEYYKNEV